MDTDPPRDAASARQEQRTLLARIAAPLSATVAVLASAVLLAVLAAGRTTGDQPPAATVTEVATAAATAPATDPSTPPAATGSPWADVAVRTADLGALAAGTAVAQPVRLTAASLDLDMPVDAVGVEADGTMTIPPDAGRAGWYRYGAAPGTPQGATLLAAHVDSWSTGIGPFARLRDVAVGTELTVTTSDGRTWTYRVAGVEQTSKDGAPVEQWFDRSGPPRLVLVTCGGAFRRDIGHYTDNVVVTAEPVDLPVEAPTSTLPEQSGTPGEAG